MADRLNLVVKDDRYPITFKVEKTPYREDKLPAKVLLWGEDVVAFASQVKRKLRSY